ncbi:fused MFS/spermidine synthase [Emticicia sp. C21]|uniref:fused MFS/spermidine synthase n=1 Tax=Emticicia sp. C21 TaxID=2302915 RepID=UPI000E3476B9|nr:fused MFS/spermidine synthase [Emticicia sp. C21]RFS13381.1 spermidine synthase [Emticicia sp. C21]
MASQTKSNKFRSVLLLFIFFFSGFAALIYQVIWQRWLVFYTGISSVSISLIVSAFMAGLGLGYLAGGQLADRAGKNRPILLFVLAETGIGLFALFSKSIIYDWLYQSNALQAGSSFQIYLILFLVLLFPTFLMGLSLPLLSKAFEEKTSENQANYISLLYFTNTLGAAIGTFVTSFVLIRVMGFENAVRLGAFFNFACAVTSIIIYYRENKRNQTTKSKEEPIFIPGSKATGFSWNRNFLYWILQYTTSGFMAICFEIMWFRMIETMMKSVALTFSIILAIYLGMMAIGTYFGVRFAKNYTGNRLRLFLNSQYFLYVYTIGSIVILQWAIKDVSALSFLFDYFKSYETSFATHIVISTMFIIPMFLMAVPTFIMGFSFTISQLIIQDKFEEVGRKVGWLQFMNIVGSTAGAWFVTLVGFNYLGTSLTIKLISLIGLVYIFILHKHRFNTLLMRISMAAVLILAVVLLPSNEKFWMKLGGMTSEKDFIIREDETAVSFIKTFDKDSFVYTNGLGQSMFPFNQDNTHIVLGAIPALIHPNPEDIGIIGLGSASTLYNAGGREVTKNLDCFEVIVNQPDAVYEFVRRSGDSSAHYIMTDKRVNLILQDGRYFLHRNDKKYDIIEADALRPKSSYSGNLYSVEYFKLLRSKLKDGGLAITWGATERIQNSFLSVFPYTYEFGGFMLVGSNKPLELNEEEILKRLDDPFTKNHYGRANIDVRALLTGTLQSKRVLQNGTTKDTPKVNLDMWPKDEFDFGRIWEGILNEEE